MKAAEIPRRAQASSSSGLAAGGRANEGEVDGARRRELVDGGDGLDPEDRAAVPVGREDLAFVALAQDVVQRDEAELPGMARGADDHDTARVEERAHCGAACVARSRDLDQRVDRDRAPVDDDQRVDVDRDDGRAPRRRARRGRGSSRRARRGRRRARPGTDRAAPGSELLDHLVGVDALQRDEPEAHVGDRLGQDAAEADHDAAPN